MPVIAEPELLRVLKMYISFKGNLHWTKTGTQISVLRISVIWFLFQNWKRFFCYPSFKKISIRSWFRGEFGWLYFAEHFVFKSQQVTCLNLFTLLETVLTPLDTDMVKYPPKKGSQRACNPIAHCSTVFINQAQSFHTETPVLSHLLLKLEPDKVFICHSLNFEFVFCGCSFWNPFSCSHVIQY